MCQPIQLQLLLRIAVNSLIIVLNLDLDWTKILTQKKVIKVKLGFALKYLLFGGDWYISVQI
jgi:hypothetical protein